MDARRIATGLTWKVLMRLQQRPARWNKDFCLVTGAPRSGTSAVGRWLHRQRGVASFRESRVLVAIHRFVEEARRFEAPEGPGEVAEMAREHALAYYRRRRILWGRRLLVDKEPLEPIAFPDREYGAFLESMRFVFPEGRFLFMIRDPLATVWSMSQRKWGYSLVGREPVHFTLEEHLENWCACARLVSEWADRPDTYVCPFGRLVNDPEGESARVLSFLDIERGEPFKPRPVKDVGFDEAQRACIERATRPFVEGLARQGITDL